MSAAPPARRALSGALAMGVSLLALACGGGGGGGGAPGPGSGSPTRADSSSSQRRFQVPAFEAGQVATAVISFHPDTPGAPRATISLASRREAEGPAASSTPEGAIPTRADLAEGTRDLPPWIEAEEREWRKHLRRSGRLGPAPPGPIRSRFGEATLPEGAETSLFIASTGRWVTVRKMHADSETVASLILAEVVDDAPVIDKSTALTLDERFGVQNPFDPAGTPISARVRSLFGSEWATHPPGGRDGEIRIVLVLLSSSGIGSPSLYGFFRPADALEAAQLPTSNQGELLYLNATYLQGDMFDGLATLAHEFQHMCNYNQKYLRDGRFDGEEEVLSLNEGLSVLAEAECGFSLGAAGGGNRFLYQSVRSYLNAPASHPFFTFASSGDYGKGYLLCQYLADRFGLDRLTEAATRPARGSSNLEAVTGLPFRQLYQEWALANLMDPVAGAPSTYRYASIDLAGSYTIRELGAVQLPGIRREPALAPGQGAELQVDPWTARYLPMSGGTGQPLDLQVTLPTAATVHLLLEAPGPSSFGSLQ